MPITRLLSDIELTPEQRRVLERAFDNTLRKIGLVDRDDPICALIAQRMIDVHRRGVTDALALSETTIRELNMPTG
jgi:hypothetical protein